jgi:hypothetical protein
MNPATSRRQRWNARKQARLVETTRDGQAGAPGSSKSKAGKAQSKGKGAKAQSKGKGVEPQDTQEDAAGRHHDLDRAEPPTAEPQAVKDKRT